MRTRAENNDSRKQNCVSSIALYTFDVTLILISYNMTTLNIASKANQATTLPPLLVAKYAQESDSNASIKINFEEVEALKADGKAVVEFIAGSRASFSGTEDVISGLIETYPFLQGKQQKSVSHKKNCCTNKKFMVG